jgi:lipopolysaccharide biosynthesis glycosyltransferase
MKWIFCVNEYGLKYGYLEHIKVALKTKPDKLEAVCIYDGDYEAIKGIDAQIIPHKLSFGEMIKDKKYTFFKEFSDNEKTKQSFPLGAYLRVDIPLVCDDDYVLYTDPDVMFNGQQLNDLEDIKPNFLAAASERRIDDWSYFNAGVMVLNVKNMRATHNDLVNYIVRETILDQKALNTFYSGRWERLRPEYNWKPYWGVNENAEIIHFHGPKPRMYNSSSVICMTQNEGFPHYCGIFESKLRD